MYIRGVNDVKQKEYQCDSVRLYIINSGTKLISSRSRKSFPDFCSASLMGFDVVSSNL